MRKMEIAGDLYQGRPADRMPRLLVEIVQMVAFRSLLTDGVTGRSP